MARHNTIDLGPAEENCPRTEEAIASAAIAPGTIVYRNTSNQFAAAGDAQDDQGFQLYIADHNFAAGRQIDDTNPANQTMIAQMPLPRKVYAALVATGQNVARIDTPLTVNNAGQLIIGTPGTDRIHFYAREVFNNTTGSAQLVAVRPAV